MIRWDGGTWSESAAEELPGYFGDPPLVQAEEGGTFWAAWRGSLSADPDRRPPYAVSLTADPQILPPSRSLGISFARALTLPFDACAQASRQWWRAEGHDGVLDVGPCRLWGPPRYDPASGQYRLDARLRHGVAWLPLRMDLELFPWLGAFGTKLSLRPRRPVRPSRHYFRAGHALLDEVVAALERYAVQSQLTDAAGE